MVNRSCRMGGCTLTGALAVTTAITDGISIVHGPSGCAHHNFSLFLATALGNDEAGIPAIASSSLSSEDVIFGGEDALDTALTHAESMGPGMIFVLTSCVAGTIGDDVHGVCGEHHRVPILVIPTDGFLGGDFTSGFENALLALSASSGPCDQQPAVNIIGEKNLDSDAEMHYLEVKRLLSLLDLGTNVRFVRNISSDGIARLGSGCANILRDPSLRGVGEVLGRRLGIPAVPGFPAGLSGTLRFLETAGESAGKDWSGAVRGEEAFQREVLRQFKDFSGLHARFSGNPEDLVHASELGEDLGLVRDDEGVELPVPTPFPVGTSGCRRLLHQWRCMVRG